MIINGVPARIWGAESGQVCIYVHGLNGNKEEAENFAGIAESNDIQVLSFDLESFNPVSLGAWFSMVYFRDKPIIRALLLSPVVRKRKNIDNLSWDYYVFACNNELTRWHCDTRILYAENDNIVPRCEIEEFAKRFKSVVKVMPDGEHWFHTEKQLKFLREWEEDNIA